MTVGGRLATVTETVVVLGVRGSELAPLSGQKFEKNSLRPLAPT